MNTQDLSNKARAKMESILANGKARGVEALTSLMSTIPEDRVVPAQRLQFKYDNKNANPKLVLPGVGNNPEETILSLHKNAYDQAATRAGMPTRFAHQLVEWGRADIAAHNLTEMYHDETIVRPDSKYLVRSVDGQARGFLSDRYRRLDSAPIVESFVNSFRKYDAVVTDAKNLDTRFFLKVALPQVFEPIPGEVLLYGLAFGNSDYGNGAISLRDYVLRLICTNGMTGEEGFRKIHLGARLGDDLVLSQKTYDLDTKTVSSAVTDIVGNLLNPEAVKARILSIKDAAETEIDPDKKIEALRKKSKLSKEEAKKVAEHFRSADVELLPAGNTSWRLSNAISLLSNSSEPERKLELEQLAGEMVPVAA